MTRTTRAIIGKELRELWRDRMSLALALVLPLILLVVFTYGLNLDIQPVRLAVFDLDETASGREYVASLSASGDLQVLERANSTEQVGELLDSGQVDIGVIVPHDFERTLDRGEAAQVQVLVDASSPPQARAAIAELDAATEMYSMRLPQRAGINPGSRGVLATLLAFLDFLLVLAAGLWWFQIPMRGSLLLLVLGGVVYVLCAVGIGLLISTLTRSQVVAMLLSILLTMMPSFLYSGFIFPLYSMTPTLQVVSRAFPARYFTDFARGIALKGAGLDVLWPDLVVLLLMTAGLLLLATTRFHRRMA
jgi:ABC-2 type transport system permease protein